MKLGVAGFVQVSSLTLAPLIRAKLTEWKDATVCNVICPQRNVKVRIY